MNVVMTGSGRFVEVQGTAEGLPFTRGELDQLLRAGDRRHRRTHRGAAPSCRDAAASPPRLVSAPRQARLACSAGPRHGEPGQGGRDRARSSGPSSVPASSCSSARRRCPTSRRPATTLEDNARLKAVALVEATGLAALADDTGLEVAALGGAPGVRSARYAGPAASYEENVDKLLRRARRSGGPSGAVPDRGARPLPRRRPRSSAEGEVAGTIAVAAHGHGGLRLRPGLRARRG